MTLFAARSTFSSKLSILALGLFVLILTPLMAHASSITYDLTLTDVSNPAYSGTGSVTFNVVPTQTYTNYSADVTALSFTINGQTFNLTDAGASLSAFEFSQLTPTATIWDITFADQIGTSPSRLALHSTAGYTYYYNNLQSSTSGTFGAATVAAPTPEPSSLLLLGTGILGGAGVLRRRFRMQNS